MLLLMEHEKKIGWNVRVFESVAQKFEAMIDGSYRGEKGVAVTAACVAFAAMTKDQRQRWVDIVKLAEGRGLDGTVAEAAEALMAELNAPPEQTRDSDTLGENPTLRLRGAARDKGKGKK